MVRHHSSYAAGEDLQKLCKLLLWLAGQEALELADSLRGSRTIGLS